jgi:nucleoside-diphosphate-sugar epimerase
MRALVAGATGYTGNAVVGELVAQGVETWAHVRPDSARLEAWRATFAAQGVQVLATPWQPDALRDALIRTAPHAVFALLGTTRARARRGPSGDVENTYQAVDYGLSRMLLDAALASGTQPRFIYLSSAGVSDRARGEYLQVRARFERELRESGLPYVIARPSFITGADRAEQRPLERAAAGVIDTLLGVAGRLGAARLLARYRSTDAGTLARALVRLSMDPAARNTIVESEGLRA